jgi:hypothetical protein
MSRWLSARPFGFTKALAGAASIAALLSLVAGCPEGGINSPSNAPHGTQCLTDMDCMSFQKCSRGSALMGVCVDKNASDEGGAPVPPPGTLITPADGGPTGPADGETQI